MMSPNELELFFSEASDALLLDAPNIFQGSEGGVMPHALKNKYAAGFGWGSIDAPRELIGECFPAAKIHSNDCPIRLGRRH
jgi:hypothetical protein